MNYVGLDTIGVGNHEFDEGKGELLRMQYGNRVHAAGGAEHRHAYIPARADGCHPVDGCQDGTPFSGSVFQYLAANVIDEEHEQPAAAAYRIVTNVDRREDRLHRRDAQGHAARRHPDRRRRARFPRRGGHGQRARAAPEAAAGVETIVLLLHQGGFQNRAASRAAS